MALGTHTKASTGQIKNFLRTKYFMGICDETSPIRPIAAVSQNSHEYSDHLSADTFLSWNGGSTTAATIT